MGERGETRERRDGEGMKGGRPRGRQAGRGREAGGRQPGARTRAAKACNQ